MMRTERPNDGCVRICVTPTRNEAWVIRPFLAASKTWADQIVVADHRSTDGTLQQLQSTAGVDVVINESPGFDEPHRKRILLDRARTYAGKRILIWLDADEALSANCLQSQEWERISEAKPGTVLRFRWVNILPGFREAWIPPTYSAFGFVDDGCNFSGWLPIHGPRVPEPSGAPVIDLKEIVVLHFQYVVWERMLSKHRWYQALEHIEHRKEPLRTFRQYHHMYGNWDKSEIHPIKPEWLEGYDRAGIDFRSLQSEPVTWWDREVMQMLREHGPERFRRIAIWDKDWNAVAARIGTNGGDLSDPRSLWEKTVHRLLKATQKKRTNMGVRGFERILRLGGW